MKCEIVARNNQITMIQRYLDGTRFYSVRPKMQQGIIFAKIKDLFKNQPVEIKISDNWLMIKKTGEISQLENKKVELKSEEEMIDKEIEILKNQGYMVTKRIMETQDVSD